MKRFVTALSMASLLMSLTSPSRAADPVDPAGSPVSEGEVSAGAQSTVLMQQAHATFQRGDVFVAVSNGRVQWHLPDGTLNKVLDTGEGGFTTGMAFDDRGHLFLTGFQTNKIYEFDAEGNLVGTFASLNGTTDCPAWLSRTSNEGSPQRGPSRRAAVVWTTTFSVRSPTPAIV